jgi:uncharacterized protein (DUF58 family)
MPAWLAWSLAAFALAAGYITHGWQGLLLAFTIVVFWLLMQFNRAVRTMRMAAGRPVGHVASAVMLQAKLKAHMPLADVVALTRSLGELVSEQGEVQTFRWTDNGQAQVVAVFNAGRLASWRLERGSSE